MKVNQLKRFFEIKSKIKNFDYMVPCDQLLETIAMAVSSLENFSQHIKIEMNLNFSLRIAVQPLNIWLEIPLDCDYVDLSDDSRERLGIITVTYRHFLKSNEVWKRVLDLEWVGRMYAEEFKKMECSFLYSEVMQDEVAKILENLVRESRHFSAKFWKVEREVGNFHKKMERERNKLVNMLEDIMFEQSEG